MSQAEQRKAAREALQQCRLRGVALADSMDERQWLARPASGGWSPAECVMHLNLTALEMLKLMRAAVEEVHTKKWRSDRPFGLSLLARGLRWFLEPPYRMKTTTQPAFVPGADTSKPEVLALWNRCHDDYDELIRASEGLDLDRAIIVSPFDPKGRAKYSVYAAFLILAAHERRHLWQAAGGRF